MKKLLIVLLALSCIFFASCGNVDDTSVPDGNPNSSEQSGNGSSDNTDTGNGGDSTSGEDGSSSNGEIWTPPSIMG